VPHIALISDTHSYLGSDVIKHIEDADEIWHAGDIGDVATAEQIEQIGPSVRMVWGNIDGKPLRTQYPLEQIFTVDGVKIYIIHIGGYPVHMNPGACGVIGFHKFRTLLKFDISDGEISNLQAVELGLRGKTDVK